MVDFDPNIANVVAPTGVRSHDDPLSDVRAAMSDLSRCPGHAFAITRKCVRDRDFLVSDLLELVAKATFPVTLYVDTVSTNIMVVHAPSDGIVDFLCNWEKKEG